MKTKPLFSALISGCLLAIVTNITVAHAADNVLFDTYSSDRIVNLRGTWRFSIGDDPRWSEPEFDDKKWTKVDAPNEWEDEGYRDYDGFAWYRKTFSFPSSKLNTQSFISLGRIDDAEEVFINGIPIGRGGQMPPEYNTAWDEPRNYLIPPKVLQAGMNNTIAIRVYDGGGVGGLRKGPLGIYETELPALLVDFSGEWLFQPGDNLEWADPEADTSEFVTIQAPGAWEHQGFPDLDGYAWYRKEFSIQNLTAEGNVVLLLGKIDDLDEVYLNGEKIAGTGDLENPEIDRGVHYYAQIRGYYFPAAKLLDHNTIAIRVWDGRQDGGIYEGPLGLVSQEAYIEFWEERRENRSLLKDFKRLFD
ncbi:Glycosyl hydrolases family 2, sugar binding domain protein [Verrucomicrobiia bacterium DG1235]|nr:Glycosyl hydrolases family 2, sugar binding domain protein [Verrucomicrobiae bacterium DG1235]